MPKCPLPGLQPCLFYVPQPGYQCFDLKTIRDKLQLPVQSINNKYYLSYGNCKQIHNVQKEEGDLDLVFIRLVISGLAKQIA